MNLSDEIISDLNQLASWLACDDFSSLDAVQPDLMVMAGHAILPTIFGALALAKQADIPVLISGGVGHSTPLLQQAVKNNPMTAAIDAEGQSEAVIIARIGEALFGIPAERVLIERNSRNCGENADFSRDYLLEKRLPHQTILLVQDPLMQRRTAETYRFSWNNKNLTSRFINWPVFTPRLISVHDEVLITGASMPGIWQRERYIAMILGEVKRLRDDKEGYGPAGAGFIGHVTLPDNVACAWARVMQHQALARLIR